MKVRTATLIEIDAVELDEQVTKFLNEQQIRWKGGNTYECVAYQEWGNDQSHSYDIDGKVDEDDLTRIREGELHWQLPTILNWMAREGVAPIGEYKIDVCW
jgi:hypothetical protein